MEKCFGCGVFIHHNPSCRDDFDGEEDDETIGDDGTAATETDVDEFDADGKRKGESSSSSSKKKRRKKRQHRPLCSNCTAERVVSEETDWKEGIVRATKKENVDVGTKKSKKSNHVPLDHHHGDAAAGDMSVSEDDEHGTITASSSKRKRTTTDDGGVSGGGGSTAKERKSKRTKTSSSTGAAHDDKKERKHSSKNNEELMMRFKKHEGD
eukprot:12214489-Ditylum_brightwellii.AAC.1